MANYSTLKASVNSYIKANGVRAITGPVLNGILTQMINTLGDGARYGGIATPSGNPGAHDNVVFFAATAAGTYTNYGGFTLDGTSLHFFVYDGDWDDLDTGVPTSTVFATKADKDTDAVAGNLAKFDSNGNPVDAGIAAEEINQLGQDVHEKFYEYPGYMQSNGAYSPQAGASFSVIKILPNVKYKITRTSSQAVTFAFLSSFDGIPDTSFDLVGSVISLSTDVAEGFVPSTANYIYLMRMYDADVKSLPIIEIDNLTITKPLDAEILGVNRKVEEIYITKKGIQDIPIKVNLGYIGLDGVLVPTTGTSWYSSDYVNIPGGSFVSGYLSGTTSNLSIAFYDADKNFISGVKSNVNFTPREFNTFAPYNAQYVRVCCYNATGNVVEDKYTKVFAFYSVDFDTIFRRIMKQKPVNTNTGYLDTNGVFHSVAPYTSWYSSDFLPCYDGCLCNVKADGALNTTLLLAFYDADKNFISGVAPQVGNTLEEYYVNAPTGTCYVRCCTNGDSIASTYFYVQTFPELELVEDNGIYGALRFAGNLRPIAFSGKKILFFGDSITKGVCSFAPTQEYPYGLKEITNCYAKLLADYVGASSFENYAISGSSFVDAGNSIKTITAKIQEVSESADIIYIAGGTNDFQLQTALGTISDTTAASVYGALHVICEYLKTTYPNAEILFATPINWSKAGIVATTKMNDYRNAIFEVATMYGYNVVDCSDIPFPRELSGAGTPAYKEATCYDGIHPTELGHQFMAGNIAKMLL